ncbi:MAG: MFS transporter [Chloroflexi bacterium]|nr:MFS transporter [Chloroflexota bacterium]
MSKHKEPGGFLAGRFADSMVERMARGPVYYGWYMVAVVFTVTMVRVGFNGHFFGIFLKPMSQEFGWTRAMTTGAVTTGTLIAVGLGIVMGRMLDRYGPRWLLVGACAILGAAYVGLSQVSALVMFYIVYAVGRSMAQSAIHNGMLSTLVSKWFVRRRTTAIAIAIAGAYVGGMALAPVIQQIITTYGWRAAWVFLGVLTWSVVLIPAALLLRRSPEDMGLLPDGRGSVENGAGTLSGSETQVGDEEGVWSRTLASEPPEADEVSLTLREATRTVTFWLLCLVNGVNSIATTGINFHTVPHFTDIGISTAVAASTVSVFTLSQFVAVFVVGTVAGRVGAKRMLLAALLTLAWGAFLIARAGSAADAYLAVAVYGGSIGARTLLFSVVWADFFGRGHLGSIRGVAIAFQLVGNASGALIAALLYDINGDYNTAFTIAVAGILVSFTMLLVARRPRPQRA